MNLLDYVSKTHVKTAKLNYDGQELEFYYKDLTGSEGEIITDKLGGLMAVISKQKKDDDYLPTSEELRDMNAMRDYTLFLQLCDESGVKCFETVEAMKEAVPAKLLDYVSKAMPKVNHEVAEKNSGNLNGSVGCSDSQTDKTVQLKTSSETTQAVN